MSVVYGIYSEMKFPGNNVTAVVNANLCIGCGVCAGICPSQAIDINENPAGFLIARVDTRYCSQCGQCINSCPGWHYQSKLVEHLDENLTGKIRSAALVQASSPELLQNGHSGGGVSALLTYLLETNFIDHAVITRMQSQEPTRTECVLASSNKEIFSAQGSKYCPAAPGRFLANEDVGKKTAFVGLPCQIAGVRMATSSDNSPLCIGLFCNGIFSYLLLEKLINFARVKKSDVNFLRYKHKSKSGWPGEFMVQRKNGSICYLSDNYRAKWSPLYKHPRCHLCWDKMNVLSDITFGDPWGVYSGQKGATLLLARTDRGKDIIDKWMNSDYAKVLSENIKIDTICNGQKMARKKRDWQAFINIHNQKNQFSSIKLYPRSQWALEKHKNFYPNKSYANVLNYANKFISSASSISAKKLASKNQKQRLMKRIYFYLIKIAKRIVKKAKNI